MTMDANQTIGTLIDATAKRDAIHVAVYPAVAAHRLRPGDHVGILPDGRASAIVQECIGVVDPFLTTYIKEGDHFWVMLYPRTITSLRHAWSHPTIPDEVADAPRPAGAATVVAPIVTEQEEEEGFFCPACRED